MFVSILTYFVRFPCAKIHVKESVFLEGAHRIESNQIDVLFHFILFCFTILLVWNVGNNKNTCMFACVWMRLKSIFYIWSIVTSQTENGTKESHKRQEKWRMSWQFSACYITFANWFLFDIFYLWMMLIIYRHFILKCLLW